jgi:dUTP pyrophosphatase
VNVKLLRVNPNAKLPTKGTKGSAYYDLYAAESAILAYAWAENLKVITTGWRIEVPEGYFLDIRPRSGLATKSITVVNSPGTVDADFRGELKIILINLSGIAYVVNTGDRIAQCALMPVHITNFFEVSALAETARGEGGYGSTGR